VRREGNKSEIEQIAECDVPPIAFDRLLETLFHHFFGAQLSGEADDSALIGPFLDQFAWRRCGTPRRDGAGTIRCR
jgi:hypothetical protein